MWARVNMLAIAVMYSTKRHSPIFWEVGLALRSLPLDLIIMSLSVVEHLLYGRIKESLRDNLQ